MKTLFKKFKQQKQSAAALCAAVLIATALLAGSGLPQTAYAWIIDIWISYTPVTTGGNTTINWYAPAVYSDTCWLTGPHIPCPEYYGFLVRGELGSRGRLCSYGVNGQYGSYTVGPITGPTTYTVTCRNDSGGWGSSQGNGQNSITVYPTPPATPTTLSSFAANPASVAYGSASTLSWSGTKGTRFSSCRLSGGQWGSGAWFTALPGSVSTQALTTTTDYSMACFDTNGTATPTRTARVTVAAAVDACSNIAGNQATPPANGTAQGGVCSCNAGFTLEGDQCVAPDVCPNIAGIQVTPPANGTTQGGSCSCNSGYELQGSSCVAVPVCPGANQTGTPPNCTCEVGYQWQGSTCVQVMCPGANEVNWPACSCAEGYSRDAGTGTCIREPQLSIEVNGTDAVRVRNGTSVVVTWSATGVAAGLCRVTTNSGETLGTSDSGSVSSVVTHQTTYRLTCQNDAAAFVSKDANATLSPDYDEV